MLYRPRLLREASPKAISRRTSYLCVRLEFHPYAQLIRTFFNMSRFDPPRNFTCVSVWPCVDHYSFGSACTDSDALFRLGFPAAPHLLLNLASTRNSLAHSSIGTPSLSLRLLVDIRFQVLFHSPPGVLFTVPSRYYSLSVTRSYLALGDGPPSFSQDSTCPTILWILTTSLQFRLQEFHLLRPTFPDCSTTSA